MRKELQLNESLAALGHGKWKRALGCTLLLIGLLAFGANSALAQDPIPDAVKLDKRFIADDETGRTGKIHLETYVTGKITSTHTSIPTDIVCVLDMSQSMVNNNMTLVDPNNGTTYTMTRLQALAISMHGFIEQIYEDATENNCNHRMSVVTFAGESNSKLLTTPSVTAHSGWNETTYRQSLVDVVVDGALNPLLGTSLTGSGSNYGDSGWRTGLIYTERTGTGTQMNTGLDGAAGVLNARTVTTFEAPDGTELARNMVVVFFTDGYPTTSGNNSSSYFTGDNITIADLATASAAAIKKIVVTDPQGETTVPMVFTIGCTADADPTAAYHSEFRNSRYYTGTTSFNGLMHFISSDYPKTLTSWSENIVNEHPADPDYDGYYFGASNAEDLQKAFASIASQSGGTPVNLGSSTVVQDVVSPSFQLPEGTDVNDIIVYAPKVINVTGTEGNYELTFADPNTVIVDGQVQFLTLVDGVVQDDDEKENRIDPSNLIEINGKTLTFSGFDFSKQFCGPTTDNGVITGWEGRKLVIEFPIEIADGVWGDGIETNGPLSFVTPDGVLQYQFPMPKQNVLGDVWTEVVVTEPDGYDPMNIETPEELAWFISEVNGRIHYNDHDGQSTNNVASNTSLNGRLTADIDMSAHNWVPIGAGYQCNANNEFILDANGKKIKLAYQGEFDGNGHVITGLKNNADKWYKVAEGQDNEVVVYPGMFSNVGANGKVHDVFILDADFRGKAHEIQGKGFFIHHGILADTLTGGQIYNCEAAGRMTCNNDNANDVNLIYGGLVGLNDGGTIYNSMAMAQLAGYTMGGAVGENRSSSSFKNGFTNGVYNYIGESGSNAKPVGGLAAINNGTIDNCYVRFERLTNENLDKATFGMLVGSGTAPTNSYIPPIVTWSRPGVTSITTQVNLNTSVPTTVTEPGDNPENSYTLSVNKTYYNMFTNDNMTGGSWGTLGSYNVYNGGTPLVEMLENGKGDGASWKRTTAGAYLSTAGNINGDFPVLQLPGYTCLASTDGITIDYAHNLSDMLHRHNSGALNENTALVGNKYKPTDHAAINGGTINLFANDDNRSTDEVSKEQSTDDNVVVYIDEDKSLLQDAGGTIEAYTGQTLKAYDNTAIQEGNRWHNISSSLSNSQFGWYYLENGQVEHSTEADPCGWSFITSNEDAAFYPVDLISYRRADFYCFYEPQYHWINFRRNGQSHWHMDLIDDAVSYDEPNNHAWIDYVNEEGAHDNEDHFIPGKGYLTAIDMSTWWTGYSREAQFLQNRGTLNNGTITIPVTTSAPEWTGLKGYNLLGNPYQSYLDFTTFAWANSSLWSDASEMTYAIYDPQTGDYVQGTAGEKPSEGALAATGDINMHQGFMIRATAAGTATFTNDMRSNTPAAGTHFRGGKANYPLVNLILTDAEGKRDIAVLEVGRPENGGGQKLRTSSAKGHISLRHDNKDFGILFSEMTEGSQPLYFDTDEDGTFTLSWNTANADFSSLTLVDNLTGVKYDMLANDSYTFQGNASDYRSRFKVVIGRFTDVEENEEVVTDNFAFFDGSDWVVNGQGQLTVTDMTGRTVYTSSLVNDQNRVSLNGVANGIYLMRVANGQKVNVQKIIIK